jgi:hypothetical protein
MTDIKHRVVDEVEALEYNIEWLIEQRRRVSKEREKDYGWKEDVIEYLRQKNE